MNDEFCEVAIVGAGAAGLSALRELSAAGVRVVCFEARDRIGGRILTIRDPGSPLPIELGPEFIHGRPPEMWELVRDAKLAVYDCEENAVQIRDGEPMEQADSWDQIAAVNASMDQVERRGEDTTFLDFIRQADFPESVKETATGFVEGFNAARKEVVGVASLARDARAAEAIEGDRNFRIVNGYGAIADALRGSTDVRLNQCVEGIEWRPGEVRLDSRDPRSGAESRVTARCCILTLPLGVLQARSVRFSPEPEGVLQAADRLQFGQVVRAVLRFREVWWEEIPHLADAGFWLARQHYFPTWWTTLPVRTPLLTGWSAGPHADALAGRSRDQVLSKALADLAEVSGLREALLRDQLEAWHFHDWRSDPFALGAYSYVPAGALRHRETLATPVANTLFFAGEASNLEGHSATVHGAIESGRRAAQQALGTS